MNQLLTTDVCLHNMSQCSEVYFRTVFVKGEFPLIFHKIVFFFSVALIWQFFIFSFVTFRLLHRKLSLDRRWRDDKARTFIIGKRFFTNLFFFGTINKLINDAIYQSINFTFAFILFFFQSRAWKYFQQWFSDLNITSIDLSMIIDHFTWLSLSPKTRNERGSTHNEIFHSIELLLISLAFCWQKSAT